jgi:hypothetical protein
MMRKELIEVILGLSVQFSGLGMAAELKHLWDFEGEQWWLDKAGAAHGNEPSESTTMEVEPGVSEKGGSLKVVTEITDGDDQFVLAADELFQPGEEAFSFFYWFRMPDDMTADPRGIFDFSGNGGDGVQSLYIGSSGELAFRIDFPGNDFALVKVPIDLEDGEWHSVAATYDPIGGLEVHIDGFGVDGSVDAVSGSVTMDTDSYLGSFNFNGNPRNNGIGGNIDDFAIYAGVLSEVEIKALAEVPEPPPAEELRIETVTITDEGVEITWNGKNGEVFGVWRSLDLMIWQEVDDSVLVGPGGGRYLYQPNDEILDRIFLQIRRTAD